MVSDKKNQNWQHTRRQKYKNIITLLNALIYDVFCSTTLRQEAAVGISTGFDVLYLDGYIFCTNA
jgi:hypothetical protein